MSARIVVTLILEYDGSDTDVYDQAMEYAKVLVGDVGDDVAEIYETVRPVEVTVTG
jgi:hypothetical protein